MVTTSPTFTLFLRHPMLTDDARYPSELVDLALRLGVNIAMYAMTH